jgi:hypothetical protein
LPPAARFEVGVGLVFNHGHVGVDFDFGLHENWFTFVGYDHFCDRRVWEHSVPRNQVTVIYNHSTVINNYVYNDKSRTVINEGVGHDRVATLSHKAVPKVTLRDQPLGHPDNGRMEKFGKGGKTLAVFRPDATTIASAKPAVHKEPVLINKNPAPVVRTEKPRQPTKNEHPGKVTPVRPSSPHESMGVIQPAKPATPVTPYATRPTQLVNSAPISAPKEEQIPKPKNSNRDQTYAPRTQQLTIAKPETRTATQTEPFPYGHRTVEQQMASPRKQSPKQDMPALKSDTRASSSGAAIQVSPERPQSSAPHVVPAASAVPKQLFAPANANKSGRRDFD